MSGAAPAQKQLGHLGKGLPELFHHSVQLAVDLGGRQLLVDGAYHAATYTTQVGHAWVSGVSRLAMKWVRLCQLAGQTPRPMAFFSPW